MAVPGLYTGLYSVAFIAVTGVAGSLSLTEHPPRGLRPQKLALHRPSGRRLDRRRHLLDRRYLQSAAGEPRELPQLGPAPAGRCDQPHRHRPPAARLRAVRRCQRTRVTSRLVSSLATALRPVAGVSLTDGSWWRLPPLGSYSVGSSRHFNQTMKLCHHVRTAHLQLSWAAAALKRYRPGCNKA